MASGVSNTPVYRLLLASIVLVAVTNATLAEVNTTSPTSDINTGFQSTDTCASLTGITFIGYDLVNVSGAVGDCCNLCQGTSGCKAYSWSDWNGGTCFLKSARGQANIVPSVTSGELPTGKTITWQSEANVDYVGNDMANAPAKSALECFPLCELYTGCRAFVWTDWEGGTCYLKTVRSATKSLSGAVSGYMPFPAATPGQCNVEPGKDYIGTDMGSSASSDPSFCCKLCSVKAGCTAYTWWAGRCYFKTAITGSIVSPNAVTGQVVAGTSNEHIAYKIRSGAIPSRSVNLGGWLVAENWMSKTSPLWTNVPADIAKKGEHYTMSYFNAIGARDTGVAQFEAHRSSWITEADIQEIVSQGLNMVRVPVGFWIVDDIPGIEPTPISSVYARGALKYLDRLIDEWAAKYNVGVYLSLHAHQGSQNGQDHSAAQNIYHTYWSDYSNNVDNSVRLATTLALRYKDSPAFVGLQLMNEPDGATNEEVVKQYYVRTYGLIRSTGNDCVIGVSPMLSKQDKNTFGDFMPPPLFTNVWVEWHPYFRWGFEDASEEEILDAVRKYRDNHFDGWAGNWLLIGEWSLGNGHNEEKFKDLDKLKEFAAAQLQQYSEAHAGWAFWSWHNDDEYLKESDGRNVINGWNLRQLLRLGIFTVPK